MWNLSEPELAYFAGILDGEGHVSADRKRLTSALVLCMADLPILYWVSERFPGSLSNGWVNDKNRSARPRKMLWIASMTDLIWLLPKVIPYLVLKRREAEFCLALAQHRFNRTSHRLTEEWKQEATLLLEGLQAARAARK